MSNKHHFGLGVATVMAVLTPLATISAQPYDRVLYAFSSQPHDGYAPFARLVAGPDGVLFGTATLGGSFNMGTVFEVIPPGLGQTAWTERVIHSFAGRSHGDGASPFSDLIADATGALYATTTAGGANNDGTVFKLTPPAAGQSNWTETVLYSFSRNRDGAVPSGLITDQSGAFYGMTEQGHGTGCGGIGCGTVFKLTPPATGQTAWTETTLHAFAGAPDGANPFAKLLADTNGALYGTTYDGGDVGGPLCGLYPGCGTVFKLTPPAAGTTAWTATVLYSFTGAADGGFPESELILDQGGALFGTTSGGGSNGNGTVFKLTPPIADQTAWTESVLHSFTGLPDGYLPQTGVTADPSGALYGTTFYGGHPSNCGTVFKLTPPIAGASDWTEAVLHRFHRRNSNRDGCEPAAGVIVDQSGVLYGTTKVGGFPGGGVVYKVVQ